MNPIARDLAALRRATREADLNEDDVHWLEDKARMWDWHDVEMLCSILEKVREAGALYREQLVNDEGVFVHKDRADWGWSTSSGGSAYTGAPGSSDARSDDQSVAPGDEKPIL